MNWFTSDLHLGHESLLKGKRGERFSSVEEHDGTVTENLIESTKPGDNLYLLGDLFWKYPHSKMIEFFTKLKRHKLNIFWIEGNHDKKSQVQAGFTWKGQLKDIVIEKQPITLCHYPLIVWNKSHYGAWQLYGHIHENDSTYNRMRDEAVNWPLGKRLNVNLDFHDMKPWSFDEISEIMKLLPENWDLIKR